MLFYSYASYGCRNLTEEETIVSKKDTKIAMKQLALEAYEKADLVFVGTLLDLKNQEFDNQTIFTPTFKSISFLKGEFSNSKSIHWVVKKGEYKWGCKQQHFFYDSFSTEINENYLVYVKSNKILRAGSFNEPDHRINADQEREWISR